MGAWGWGSEYIDKGGHMEVRWEVRGLKEAIPNILQALEETYVYA